MKANERISGAPRTSIWRSARAKATRTMPIPSFKLAATRSAPKFLSSHRETALCSSLTETLPLCTLFLLQANTPPWQTSKCSSWVVAGLVGASVGFMLPPTVPSSRSQQLWVCQTIAHWWPGSLGQPSRKPSDISHIGVSLNG